MKIERVYLERTKQYRLDCEITQWVRNNFTYENGQVVDPEAIILEQPFFLEMVYIPEDMIPTMTYKNKVKNPKRVQIDILLTFSQNDILESKPIRYRQPDPNDKKNNSERIEVTPPINLKWEGYVMKSDKQLHEWYKSKESDGISSFENFYDFKEWYQENVQDKSCFYCGITEKQSQKIIHEGILTSLRFPIYGVFSKGVNRGYWLEIDRKNPTGFYSRENCVPSCYFCNNDKSDVFTDDQYGKYIIDRGRFLVNLPRNEE